MSLKTLCIVTGQLETNCYLLWQDGSAAALVFDPGDDANKIEAELQRCQLKPEALLLTHCHFDHFGALAALKTRHPHAPIYVPEKEAAWLQRPTLNLSYFFGAPRNAPPADHLIQPDTDLQLAGIVLKCIHVPGHSPGGTAYYAAGAEETPHLFAGDILMCGGIGRGDLPGAGGEEVLVAGIREKLFKLPDETIVHPGHGPETTIGEEKAHNPFCG